MHDIYTRNIDNIGWQSEGRNKVKEQQICRYYQVETGQFMIKSYNKRIHYHYCLFFKELQAKGTKEFLRFWAG